MIKILVVEDNLEAFEIFQTIVNDFFPELTILSHFTTAEDAYLFIKKNSIDWLILDIELKGAMNGFDLLDLIGDNAPFKILFFTGLNEENIKLKAIRHNAFDFFSKPISISEISQAILRYNNLSKTVVKRTIQKNMAQMDEKQEPLLYVNTHEKSMYLKHSDIISIKASGAYSVIEYKGNNAIKCAKNLQKMEQELNSREVFIRISRSVILNKTHIVEIQKLTTRDANLILSENRNMRISSIIKNNLIKCLESKNSLPSKKTKKIK